MVTDYRAIMIAVLRGQTYATIQESFRCSSKTIRCVKRVVEDHGLTESDVQGLDAERLAGLFPDRRFERDESYAEIDTAALIRRKRIFAAKNPGRKFKIKAADVETATGYCLCACASGGGQRHDRIGQCLMVCVRGIHHSHRRINLQ